MAPGGAALQPPSNPLQFQNDFVLEIMHLLFYNDSSPSSNINFPTLLIPAIGSWTLVFGLLFFPFSLAIFFKPLFSLSFLL